MDYYLFRKHYFHITYTKQPNLDLQDDVHSWQCMEPSEKLIISDILGEVPLMIGSVYQTE
jgi:hypothetical protein